MEAKEALKVALSRWKFHMEAKECCHIDDMDHVEADMYHESQKALMELENESATNKSNMQFCDQLQRLQILIEDSYLQESLDFVKALITKLRASCQ